MDSVIGIYAIDTYKMGVARRHYQLTRALSKYEYGESFSDVFDLAYDKDFKQLYKENPGNDVINYSSVVQPDFFVFTDNNCWFNKKFTRVAGEPNLVVEVWSESNSPLHRQLKLDLYSTGSNTEHWYIEQDSDVILCFLGKNRLNNQNISSVLRTQSGLEFDLRKYKLDLS